MTTLALAVGVLGCGSGTESVPVPGADAVVTAPAVSFEREPVDEPPASDPATTTGAVPSTTESRPPPATASPATSAAPPATDPQPPPSDADVFLRLGDEGPEVATMQRKLASIDYLPDGSDTGVFDEATRSGLRQFQGDYGLGVDGIFGPITGRALNAAVSSINAES